MPRKRRLDPSTKLSRLSEVEHEKYLQRLEHKLLRGVTSVEQLAAAFDRPYIQVRDDIIEVRKRWLANSPTNTDEARVTRTRQLENVVQLALDAFQRSRLDVEEIRTVEERCRPCLGSGKIRKPTDPTVVTECPDCGGRGVQAVETRTLKGQPGDATFLKTAIAAIAECAKIEGVMNSPLSMRSLTQITSQLPDGSVKSAATEVILEAPIDVLIRAKAILEEIQEGKKNGQVRIIDASSEAASTLSETRKNAQQYEDNDLDDEETPEAE